MAGGGHNSRQPPQGGATGGRQRPPRARLAAHSRWVFHHAGYGISLVVTLAAVAFYVHGLRAANHRGFWDRLEYRSLDARFLYRAQFFPQRPAPQIVLVTVDQATLEAVGAWPISRLHYAHVIDRLAAAGARVIAFDIDFAKPDPASGLQAVHALAGALPGDAPLQLAAQQLSRQLDTDQQLAASIARHADRVVLGYTFLDEADSKAQDAAVRLQNDTYLLDPVYNLHPAGGLKTAPAAAFATAVGHRPELFKPGAEMNYPVISEAAARRLAGYFNYLPDVDGSFRRAPLVMGHSPVVPGFTEGDDLTLYPSEDVQIYNLYQYPAGTDPATVAPPDLYINPVGVQSIRFRNDEITPDPDGTLLINYPGPKQTYPHLSLAAVEAGHFPPHVFENKIVLIGATALGIGDLRTTPVSTAADFPGVEIHAAVLGNLLQHNFLRHGFQVEMVDLGVLLLFGLGLGALFSRLSPLHATLAFLCTAAAFTVAVVVAFIAASVWLAFVLPAATLFINFGAVTSYRVVFEDREKRRVRRSFGQYVAPEVVELIERDPERFLAAGGETRELTIFFSDIRGFTGLSEGLSPEELVTALNEYFERMTAALFHRQGTLDKYIGDAIMAFWGAPSRQPDHAVKACAAALEMRAALAELNQGFCRRGLSELGVGIGLNSGPAVVGNMGSTVRFNYTVMGDAVNLASRLEGMTKQYGVAILVSEATRRAVGDRFVFRELDVIRVKGKTQPVRVFELLDFVLHERRQGAARRKGPDRRQGRSPIAATAPTYPRMLQLYEVAYAAYGQRDFRTAHARFVELLREFPQDGPSRLLADRCAQFLVEEPSHDWDGVYVMHTK
ncbi:MAG: CHASE2 domain-containing protein [Terriglobales bacterium]